MSNRRIPITCKTHGVEYDGYDEQCPKCLADRSAYNFTLRKMTCGLCKELKATTVIMCGGPIGQLCDECRVLIRRWEEAKKKHKKRIEDYRSQFKENSEK